MTSRDEGDQYLQLTAVFPLKPEEVRGSENACEERLLGGSFCPSFFPSTFPLGRS